MNTKTVVIGILYTAGLNNDTINIVSNDKDSLSFPQIDISTLNPKKHNLNLDSILKLLFEKSVNISFEWSRPKLLNIELSYDEELNTLITAIFYSIFIPNNTSLNDSYWIDIKPYIAHYDTLRKLVCIL
jgi:hypothetical protein